MLQKGPPVGLDRSICCRWLYCQGEGGMGSTPSYPGGGGAKPFCLDRRGTPTPSCPDWEAPWGTPPESTWGPVEVLWDGDGVSPRVWTDTRSENITFHHHSDAVGKNAHTLMTPQKHLQKQRVEVLFWMYLISARSGRTFNIPE